MSLCNYWYPSDLTELKRVFDELDGGSRRSNNPSSNLPSNKSAGLFVPRMDLVEQSDSHTLVVELPGYKKDAVSISLDNNRLTISGEAGRSQEYEQVRADLCLFPINVSWLTVKHRVSLRSLSATLVTSQDPLPFLQVSRALMVCFSFYNHS